MSSRLSMSKVHASFEPRVSLDELNDVDKNSPYERKFDALMSEVEIQLGHLIGDVESASGKKLEKVQIKKDIKHLDASIKKLIPFLKTKSVAFYTKDQILRINALLGAQKNIGQQIIDKRISTSGLHNINRFSTLQNFFEKLTEHTVQILDRMYLVTETKKGDVKNEALGKDDKHLVDEADIVLSELIEEQKKYIIRRKRSGYTVKNMSRYYYNFTQIHNLIRYKFFFKDSDFKGFLEILKTGQSDQGKLLQLFTDKVKLPEIMDSFKQYKKYVEATRAYPPKEGEARGVYKTLRNNLNKMLGPEIAVASYRELHKY